MDVTIIHPREVSLKCHSLMVQFLDSDIDPSAENEIILARNEMHSTLYLEVEIHGSHGWL